MSGWAVLRSAVKSSSPTGTDASIMKSAREDGGVRVKSAAAARVAFFSQEIAKHTATRPAPPGRISADPYGRGSKVFYRDSEEGWLVGTVHKCTGRGGDKVYLVIPGDRLLAPDGAELESSMMSAVYPSNLKPKESIRLRSEELAPAYEASLRPSKDILDLPQLHEAVVLHQLRTKAERGELYTRLGSNILVAVGAKDDEECDTELLEKYIQARGSQVHDLPHHVWGSAHHILWTCLSSPDGGRHQALVVTGQAGSAKSHATREALRYLVEAAVAQSNEGPPKESSRTIGTQVLNVLEVLGAFVSASTNRNPSSTRAIQWIELFITSGGSLVAGWLQPFLLERVRAVSPPPGERTFLIFYHMLAGLDATRKKRLGLDNPATYEWLYQTVVVADEDEGKDAAAYAKYRQTLTELGLAPYELHAIDQILAGIIHLRSIKLYPNGRAEDRGKYSSLHRQAANWTPENEERVRLAAALWGVDPHMLFGEVASVTAMVRNVRQTRRLGAALATEARDNICKAVYCGLVSWLYKRVNMELAGCDVESLRKTKGTMSIAVVDVVGFEDNKTQGNQLQQLLANTVNEEMQRMYNVRTFEEEVEEYREEGLDMMGLIPPDNTKTIELVCRGQGILSVLDEQSRQGGALGSDERFLELVSIYNASHPSLHVSPTESTIGVRHSAGLVWYGPVSGWRTMNTDPLRGGLRRVLSESTNNIVSQLLPAETIAGDVDGAKEKELAADTEAQQLLYTMRQLQELLKGRGLHWVRCIRPSAGGQGVFRGGEVLSQIRSMGIMETVRIRRHGFPVRLPVDYFLGRYRGVVRGSSYDDPEGDPDSITVEAILRFAGIADRKDSQVGKNKVFLKDAAHSKLEDLRLEVLSPSRMVTGFIAAKMSQKAAKARMIAAGEDVGMPGSPRRMGHMLATAQQTMKVLAAHLPVFLAFARGYLASQLVLSLAHPEATETETSVAETTRVEELEEAEDDMFASEIVRNSAPLRKLAEWKRQTLRTKAACLGPPPGVEEVDYVLPSLDLDTATGALGTMLEDVTPMPQLDPGDTTIRQPTLAQHDFTSIILREAETLNKMSPDDLFECLGQGRREVHAPLRLSSHAIDAIRRLVAQGELDKRHQRRAELTRMQEEMDAAQAQGKKLSLVRRNGESGGFPDTLGPMAVRPCPTGLVSRVKNGRYTIALTGALTPLFDAGVPGEGRVSPESIVTLPVSARRRALIPRLAHSFVWAYPLPGMDGLGELTRDTKSTAVQFVTFGGFIYLDQGGNAISANSLAPGEGLRFDGPFPWGNEDATRKLANSGRLQPVTIRQLQEAGACMFCWLLPGEDLGLDPPPKHGGFLYLFRMPHEKPHPDDRYFTVGDKDDSGPAHGMRSFSKSEKDSPASPLTELPRIRGMKDLEGVLVTPQVAEAVKEVIAADETVQRARAGIEPVNPTTAVQITKHHSTVNHSHTSALSPVRHHRRRPEEFADIPGGYLGWTPQGIPPTTTTLDYSGEKYPFPAGVAVPLSPTRSAPFLEQSVPSNARTAFGRSVDGRREATKDDTPLSMADTAERVRSVWLETFQGTDVDVKGREKPKQGGPPRQEQLEPYLETAVGIKDTVDAAYGVHGVHAGHVRVRDGEASKRFRQASQHVLHYIECMKAELERQQ